MRNELTQIEFIEQYLEGKLNAAENTAFEQRIQVDAELKGSVELQKTITDRIETLALKSVIQKVHNARYGRGFNLNSWLLALVICIGIGFAAWGYFRKADAVSASRALGADTAIAAKADVIDSSRFHPQQENNQQAQLSKPTEVKKIPVQQSNTQKFTVPFAVYAFNAEDGGTFKDKRSGSTITVPAGILTDADGKPIKGAVKLYYREFRDAADMAYSGIPMVYKTDAGDYRFNSAGMFELHVLKDNDSLSVKKGKALNVDFVMTQSIPKTAFYKLNTKRKNWSEVGKIEQAVKEARDEPVASGKKSKMSEGALGEALDSASLTIVFGDSIAADGIHPGVSKPAVFYAADDKRSASMLAARASKGHTYPVLVSGLLCKDFGVFNCDQIYRIGTMANIIPVFKDTSGNVIGQQNILTMIDLDYNGSFSFDPQYSFQLNPADKNVLLLFTNDNKVYSYTQEDFKKNPVKNGSCTFVMGDITTKVKNTEDLRSYLGLAK